MNKFRPSTSGCTSMFNGCNRIKDFPEGFGENWIYSDIKGSSYGGFTYLFASCYSLREAPLAVVKNAYNNATSAYSSCYYYTFQYCASLNEIKEIPITPASLTSNLFTGTFENIYRVKDILFQTNEDGTPKTAKWKNQIIDLTKNVGWVLNSTTRNYITNYNSGITADKEVIDDATYQALKNDEDWFSLDVNYCRYNHDSAVRTIASLPDCSATGTNTIKFKGASGALTDGGAINTLTEAEIAVAAAKGWTVSLV